MAAETDIFTALVTHLSGMTLSPTLAIAWPGVNFAPTNGVAHLRASFLPGLVEQITLGDVGVNRHLGTFQVDVMWPENAGELAPLGVAASIVARFKRGTELTSGATIIRIIRPPNVAPPIQDPPRRQYPVSIAYQADAPNPA